MIDLIQYNPYRILGVYSNSSKRDVVANKAKLKAFLKVKKPVSFPLDLPVFLPNIERNADAVEHADAEIMLSEGKLMHAQFWFIKFTPIDDIAFGHLLVGNVDTAIEIWKKKTTFSSLQNQLVCALINKNLSDAILYAEELYANYSEEFVKAVAGDNFNCSSEVLIKNFVEKLISSKVISSLKFLNLVQNEEWKKELGTIVLVPLIKKIDVAVLEAKQSAEDGGVVSLKAGEKLMKLTKPLVQQLRIVLSQTDLRFQLTMDKLGLQILQCGINYFNETEEVDAAEKSLKIQKYAASIVVGNLAKDRCKDNLKTLEEIIKNLPPREVRAEFRTIVQAFETFNGKTKEVDASSDSFTGLNLSLLSFLGSTDKIDRSIRLLKDTKESLFAIKLKMGLNDNLYLKLSNQAVAAALDNIIKVVNSAQKQINLASIAPSLDLDTLLKKTLEEAWKAIKMMDHFDMEDDFRMNRYSPNRKTLKKICSQLGISTAASSVRSYSKPSSSSNRPSQPSSKPSWLEENLGCLIIIVGGLIAFLILSLS